MIKAIAKNKVDNLGGLFFLVKNLNNQCIASLRTYFLSFLEVKRVASIGQFILGSCLK